jgi:ABC-type lipoprotein export system ATPase subunit
MSSDKKTDTNNTENEENINEEVSSKFIYDDSVPNLWKTPNPDKDEETNDLYICWKEFGIKPSKVSIYSEFNSDLLWEVIKEEFDVKDKSINKISEIIPEGTGFIYNTKYLIRINENLYLSFLEFDKMPDENDSFCSNLTFYYNQLFFNVEDLNELLLIFQPAMDTEDKSDPEKNIFSVNFNQSNQLELLHMNINLIDWDDSNMDEIYPNSTIKGVRKMIKKINKNDKGLHILCGPRGCGKTTFLNTMISKFKKKVIYIPLTMIEHTLNNLDFAPFLSLNKDSIIIIDDCENYFNKTHQKSNIYVSNLLQLLDSINSDCRNINIIISMNIKVDSIDDKLLECNHFTSIVEFKKMNNKKAMKLSKKLGFGKKYLHSAKLVDVVNDKKGIKDKKYL